MIGHTNGVPNAWRLLVAFIPRHAVLIDQNGREVAVVPFTRRLDWFVFNGEDASASERADEGVRPESRSRRMFRMTNEVDRHGRPILREMTG
jgi:hypothetical protein